ncbi:hypothetical protein RRG08_063186 [Elysia crispata]|uniref:Uncharacterized protein n=1 Tax=Elysia crispata TaxID=231223 RepID=A0AAE0YTH0_9GAST|nr:hypothetical protein RRG08_063186 [Elysia crispata]
MTEPVSTVPPVTPKVIPRLSTVVGAAGTESMKRCRWILFQSQCVERDRQIAVFQTGATCDIAACSRLGQSALHDCPVAAVILVPLFTLCEVFASIGQKKNVRS